MLHAFQKKSRRGIATPKADLDLIAQRFSSERPMRLLTALGQDVEIVVRAKPRHRRHGRIRVVGEAKAA